MDIKELFREDERPLERLIDGSGFCDIFHTVGCVGDSLSSGEFETKDAEGKSHYDDNYPYSWGQVMARITGNTYYNFSKGGLSAKTHLAGEEYYDAAKVCDAYIVALGVNDCYGDIFNGKKYELGDIGDVDFENYENNKETAIGYYAKVIGRYKKISPFAKFFLVTMPQSQKDEEYRKICDRHAELVRELAEKLDRAYVVDLRRYAPVYDDEFRKKFFLNSHMNAAGYAFTARLMLSYIDYTVRHNLDDFKHVGTVYER